MKGAVTSAMIGKEEVTAKEKCFTSCVSEHAENVVSILPTPFMYIYTRIKVILLILHVKNK